MSNFTVSARIDGNAKGLVQASRDAKGGLDQIEAAGKAVTASQRDLSAATTAAAEALGRGGRAAIEQAGAQRDVATATTMAAEALGRSERAAIEAAGAQIEAAAAAQIVAQRARDEAAALAAAQQAAREAAAVLEALARGELQAATATDVHAKAQRAAATAANTNARAQRDAATATSSGLTRNQAQQLRYQGFDIATSLAGGMNPALIAMQQGPQILQAFDGPRDAAQKLLGALGPLRLGIVGVTGALAAGVMASESYAASVRQIDVALALHGDRLNLTREEYLRLASASAEVASVSEREGRTMLSAMINAGVQSRDALMMASEAARGYAVATGQDASEAAAALAEKLKTPAKSARELAGEFNLLDEATVRQIESMERQGDVMGAQVRLAGAMKGKFAPLADETSGWARAFEWLGNAASNAWDAVGNFLAGSPKSNTAALEAAIAETRQQLSGMGWSDDGPGTGRAQISNPEEIAALEIRLRYLTSVKSAVDAVGVAIEKADERARDSRIIGDIEREYRPESTQLNAITDKLKLVDAQLAKTDLSAEDRKIAESARIGLLQRRAEIQERLAKQGDTDGAKEAARLQERLTLQRQDLDLLQQIVAARAKGDDDAARRLQGQRDAARRGFDLSTPDGQAAAEIEARSDQLAAALKAMDDVEARMARLNPNVTLGANGAALAADLRAAARWKSETIAAFEGSEAAARAYADQVDIVFNDMVASAYEEDLRRRTDWAAGVERAFIDLKREGQDFASVAERSIKDASATIKDELISAALSGEASFDRLGDAFARMIMEMAYQKYLASQVEGAVGWAVDIIGSVFGLGGGAGGGGSIPKTTAPVGKRHGGGMGHEPFTSVVSLPKHHDGWMGRRGATGEHDATIRNDEGVFTPRQMDNADRLIEAMATRPIVVNLADERAARADDAVAPKVTVNVYGAPGGAQVEQRRDQNGDMTIDVMLDQMEERMAMKIGQGRSPINAAIEGVYGGTRQVA